MVEQVLMCSLKSIRGLSHGRIWSEARQFSRLLSISTCAEYSQPSETQKLNSVSFVSSDKHQPFLVYCCPYITHGKPDIDKLTRFVTCGLFSSNTALHCIVTGAVTSVSVTLDDDDQSTRMRILKDMMDQEVTECIFPIFPNRSEITGSSFGGWDEWRGCICPPPYPYFNVWVWLHLLRHMSPGKHNLLMSYTRSL